MISRKIGLALVVTASFAAGLGAGRLTKRLETPSPARSAQVYFSTPESQQLSLDGWRPEYLYLNAPIAGGVCDGRIGNVVGFIDPTGDSFSTIDCGLPGLVDHGREVYVDSVRKYDWEKLQYREELGNWNSDALASVTRAHQLLVNTFQYRTR